MWMIPREPQYSDMPYQLAVKVIQELSYVQRKSHFEKEFNIQTFSQTAKYVTLYCPQSAILLA